MEPVAKMLFLRQVRARVAQGDMSGAGQQDTHWRSGTSPCPRRFFGASRRAHRTCASTYRRGPSFPGPGSDGEHRRAAAPLDLPSIRSNRRDRHGPKEARWAQ